MLPETNNEPCAENDAAKAEDDAKERPKSTMGVIGGISARSCRPAAAPILQTQDHNVPLMRGLLPASVYPLIGHPRRTGSAGKHGRLGYGGRRRRVNGLPGGGLRPVMRMVRTAI